MPASTIRRRRYPSDTSVAEWTLIEQLLPLPACPSRTVGRPEEWHRRDIVDAIRYLVDNGVKWRALPADYPPWQTVYYHFAAWHRRGVIGFLRDQLRRQIRTDQGRCPWSVTLIVDSQSVKGAETVSKATRGFDAGKKINGRKRHIAVDTLGLPVMITVTPADTTDRDAASGQLTARRQEIKTRWRRLSAARQALLTLAHLRCGDTYAQLAAGFGIGIATVYRYIREAVDTLSTLAPSLAEAMRTIRTKAFVILDGTLLPIDRIAADTPYYSGKHTRHGTNVQVLTDPFGRLLWASPALPGSTHDLTAARQNGIIEALADAGLKCWADKAYQGAGGSVRVPFRRRRLRRWKRRHNTTHAKIRCVGERAMATLKGWRLRRKLRCSTRPSVQASILLLDNPSSVG